MATFNTSDGAQALDATALTQQRSDGVVENPIAGTHDARGRLHRGLGVRRAVPLWELCMCDATRHFGRNGRPCGPRVRRTAGLAECRL